MLTPLVLAAFFAAASAQLTINTPNNPAPSTCEPSLITWSGGTPPYFVVRFSSLPSPPFIAAHESPCRTSRSVVDGNDQTNVLVNFGQLSNNSITWNVVEPAGTLCLLTIKDSTGAAQTSATFTVTAGVSTSCLTGGSSTTGGSTTGSATGSTTGTTTSTTATTGTTTKGTTTAPPTSGVSTPASKAVSSGSASGSAPPRRRRTPPRSTTPPPSSSRP
ncbi:hypothetical protein HMN09_00723600 [Mycena chlorophos]|uniref:Uncharacterized protein n=1 Tax=Mycena chlorophos TaxID=658473 RepID=A0A8H6SUM9_MYCCL|nr:hypothetical protein HMN09_00723600 [Mycena chlorophos]